MRISDMTHYFNSVLNQQRFMTQQEIEKLSELKQMYENDKIASQPTPIQYCEQNYPEMCREFKDLQQKQYDLLCKKQMDYGPGNIAVGTQLKNDKEIMASLKAIIVRVNDKIQRLINLILINNRNPTNESIEDSFMDLAVYATIALTVRNGKWGK